MIDRVELKMKAKRLLHTSNPSPMVAGAMYLILTLMVSALVTRLMNLPDEETLQRLLTYMQNGQTEAVERYLESVRPTTGAYIIYILLIFVTLLVGVGLTLFMLNTVRGSGPVIGNLVDGFFIAPKALLLKVLSFIAVYLGSLLFVVPGIVLSMAYSQTVYIMLDHPEYSAIRCMTESRLMMRGHKWEYFVLRLSFIGWQLLTVLPFVGSFASVYVLPYTELSFAQYYQQVSGYIPAEIIEE